MTGGESDDRSRNARGGGRSHVVVGGLIANVVTASPAHAKIECPSVNIHICFYEHSEFGGKMAHFHSWDDCFNNDNFKNGGNINDKASSVEFNLGGPGSEFARMYQHCWRGGHYIDLRKWEQGFSWRYGDFWNDQISSFEFLK